MVEVPHGCRQVRNDKGITIARVHYSADPAKDAAWVEAAKKRYLTEAMWNQEMEIQGDAQSGQLVFPNFHREYAVCSPFKIPHEGYTRYMALDPHPRVPHAMLWMAVGPDGGHYYYREYWPSRAYGQFGDVPEDDKLLSITEYCQIIKFLEGPDVSRFDKGGFADNQGKQEHIYRRVIDTYAKAVPLNVQDGKADLEERLWDGYRDAKDVHGNRIGVDFEPAKKDWNASTDKVNNLLKPRRLVDSRGERQESVISIFDTCPELILELTQNRYPRLTPTQAAKQDPADTPLPKRKHLSDLLRYIEMLDPVCVNRRGNIESVEHLYADIAY